MRNDLKNPYQINEEYNVITEARDPMGSGHGDDKGENVIDKCIEGLVHERTPWKRCHRL